MGELVEFLQSNQLGDLAEVFLDEEITFEQLLQMDDCQFKEIGITKMGHRMALLSAAQNIKQQKDKELRPSSVNEPSCTDSDEVVDDNRNNQDDASAAGSWESVTEQVSTFFEVMKPQVEKAKRHFPKIYDKILLLLERKEFFPQLKEELTEEYGDINQFIMQGMEDLKDESYPIIVTGEISAGKSSFVNLLLGEDILPQNTLQCTAAICRIHNCDEKKVKLTYKSEKQTDLDIQPDIEAIDMKTLLKQHVSIQSSSETKSLALDGDVLQFVDIWWPIKKLPKGLLVVDTPGIGPDDPNLTEKLYEYLPKALAFIYVINTTNGGGVQKDRLLQIQCKLAKYQGPDGTYFDSNRAVFICNKWDQIHEDPEEVYVQIQQKISEAWTGFDSAKMFKLSTLEEIEKCKVGKPISLEFKAVLDGIKEIIPATVKDILRRHDRKQRTFIKSVQKKLTARIATTMKSKEEKVTLISGLKEKIFKVETSLSSKLHSVISKAEQECNGIPKRIYSHLINPKTKAKLFSWSSGDLPDGGNYREIIKELDAIVKQRIAVEINDCIQICIENFVGKLFRDKCYAIMEEVDEIENYIYNNDCNNSDCSSISMNDGHHDHNIDLTLRQTVALGALGVSASLLVTANLQKSAFIGLVLIPVGVAMIKNLRQITTYNRDKSVLANERAELYLKSLSEKTLQRHVKKTVLKNIEDNVNTFFGDVIPKRLSAAKALITNIENDLREPAVIRRTCHKVERFLRPINGHIIAAEMDVFGENNIKSSDIFDIKQTKGGMLIAGLNYKQTKSQSVVKRVTFNDRREAGWTCLAEIHEFRKLKSHPNLLEIYGVHVPEPGGTIKKLHILY